MFPDRPTGRCENAVKVSRGIFGTDMTHAPEVGQGRLDDATELEAKGEHVESRTEIR